MSWARGVAIVLLALGLGTTTPAAGEVHFDIPQTDVLIDERIRIALSGLAPHAAVTVHLRGGENSEWMSNATFVADDSGTVDLTRMAPVRGSYKEIDAMGLFWSLERQRGQTQDPLAADDARAPESWTLTAEVAGQVVARTTLHRRSVAEGVRFARVRTNGLVGTFYEPSSGASHPAMIVLGGSEGGIPGPAGFAGGFASRGYAVLALAYFRAEGLPNLLSNIPLEYFGTAIAWLKAQPSVDANRIGVVGGSRGAELALLLGSVYPSLRVVVANMPSNVVIGGCCDPGRWFYAWTVGGRPIAAMPPRGRRGDAADAQQAEIQVERINGPVLLLSGKDDGVWPSSESAEKIVARLKRNRFPFPYESLVYEHTGHGISRPYTPTTTLNGQRNPTSGRLVDRGGTPSGTAKAREESWPKMLAFVGRAFNVKDAPGSATTAR
jgi:dienelactone hydrolase